MRVSLACFVPTVFEVLCSLNIFCGIRGDICSLCGLGEAGGSSRVRTLKVALVWASKLSWVCTFTLFLVWIIAFKVEQ